MSDFIVPSIEQNQRAEAFALDTLPASFGEGFGAAFEEGIARNPVPTIGRWLERSQYYPYTDEFGQEQPAPTSSRMLTAEEATTQYGIPGRLTFSEPTPEPVAQQLAKLKREEIERQETMRRAEVGIGTQLTAGLAASLLDPINVASAFIPVVGPARYGLLVERYGAMGARAITGAVEGAVGAAVVEPIVLAGARQEQADYTMADSLVNLAFGTAMGSGLHLLGGAVGDRIKARETASPLQRQIDDLPRQDQEALLRTAVSQVAEGRAVDVTPIFDAVAASPRTLEDAGFRQDNPAVSRGAEGWLREKQEDADASYARTRGITGAVTANFRETVTLRVADLEDVPGARGEKRGPGEQQFEELNAAVKKEGWRQSESPILIGVNHRGEAFIVEGNTRLAVARENGIETVAADIRWYNGGETVDGAWAPDRVVERLDQGTETRNFRSSLEAAQRTAEPADIRAAEASAARAELEPGAPKPVADDITAIEEELTFMETLMDPERATEFKKADEATKEANMMAKAWEAAVACRVRNS